MNQPDSISTNSKYAALMVLAIFLVWSGISWYWYTCGIKGFCGNENIVLEEPLPETVLPVVDVEVLEKPLFDELPNLPTCHPYLTRAVTVKGPNYKQDVMKVQHFLNTYHFQKNVLPVNGIFGARTIASVKDFQNKYKATILTPYRLKYGTGNVTKRTLEEMNSIVCGSASKDKIY